MTKDQKDQIEKMSDVKAILVFFGEPKVTMADLKAIGLAERKELGELCREEMLSRL